MVVEEVIVAAETFLNVRNTQDTMVTINLDEEAFIKLPDDEKREYYHKLSKKSKTAIEAHYNSVYDQIEHKQQTMALESSIQLTYQNALIIYELMNPPLYELDYNSWSYPSARWMLTLILQLASVLLSAYGTFSPIVKNLKFQSFIKRRPVGFADYILKLFQVIIHIVIGTGVVYLVRGYTYIIYPLKNGELQLSFYNIPGSNLFVRR